MNKWPVITNEIRMYSPDIVLISESWIPGSNDYSHFNFDNYVSFADSRIDRRGGGTLILARASLRPTQLKLLGNYHHRCNIVAINIGVAERKTVVCCAYRPPDSTISESNSFIEQLEAINSSADVRILAGDFNLPHINWVKPSLTRRDNVSNVFQQACDEMGVTQCVTSNTLGNHVLDLVLLSHPNNLAECKCCPPIATSDHQAVLFAVSMKRAIQTRKQRSVQPIFDKADLQYAAQQLLTVNWRIVFSNDRHVDDYVASFMSVFVSILTKSLLANVSPSRPNHARIVPKHIRALTLKKRRLWKKVHDVRSLQVYLAACDNVKVAIRQYTSRQELDLVNHPNQAAFYKYVSRALGQQQVHHQLVNSEGNAVTDDVIAAEMFNAEFSRNFSRPLQHTLGAVAKATNTLVFSVSQQETYAALASSSNSSPGPDGISGSLLRQLAPVLALPLSIIFQQSLAQNVFPTAWKTATVIPVYKGKGPKTQASSYRPISLCSTIGKALERIVNKQIIDNCKPVVKTQHGFTKGRSTLTNLLCAEHEIAECVNNKHPYDVITFDFSRAFDRVPHHLLLHELANRGISGKALVWLQSYLSGRTQAVRVAGALSSAVTVTSGVIQGSSLGPTLFTIYIDSLLSELDITSSAYADDLKFIVNLSRISQKLVQDNIDKVHRWSASRGMPLSVEKCLVLHCGSSNPRYDYQCGSSNLPVVESLTDLGITRSCDGTYSEHVSSVVQKGRRLVGMCFRGLQSRDASFLMRVYKTYILPVLNYASPIWSPHLRQEVDELEAIQRKFTKRLEGQSQCTYGRRLHNLSLLSLESQRLHADLLTVHRLRHNGMDMSLEDAGLCVSSSNTRGGGVKLVHLRPTSVAAASHFNYRAASLWNSLPTNITGLSNSSSFKLASTRWLFDADTAFFD
jgi:hypothetical protein